MKGFHRIAAITPSVSVANPLANAKAILDLAYRAYHRGAQLILTPELSLTGYTCGDLFGSASLAKQTKEALDFLQINLDNRFDLVVGLPVAVDDRLYNCAAVIHCGSVVGYVPKTHLPTYREFYEKRHFVSGAALPPNAEIDGVPIGTDLLFDVGAFRFGIEICEDLWAVDAPSNRLAAARAHLILNPSASTEAVGKAAYRRDLVRMQSARLSCAYAYASAGSGESTTDVVYGAHRILANNGRVLAESRWEEGISLMDFRPDWIDAVRRRETSFPELPLAPCRVIQAYIPGFEPSESDGSLAGLDPTPFVPADDARRQERCREILRIQVAGLTKRFTHTHAKRLVIGLSGGLDSTLALLVCHETCKRLGLPPRETILAVTMPGFGTSHRTHANVQALAQELDIELREIPIGPGVEQHFKDIGHDPAVRDITYENAQARARTYKTLVRYCVESVAADSPADLAATLRDICDTPVSPELLPGDQQTEAIVGSYELHDCFLYYFMKYGCDRDDLRDLATFLLGDRYDAEEIERTLNSFCRRFVTQQFKRSAIPDGPKVGTVALSPRGDWRMPSDASFTL